MANAEIKIPNLTPGKRYRMVIETTNSAGQVNVGTTSMPSIEFNVPASPRLLSTYRPTYRVFTTNYPATGGEITGYTDVYGEDPPPYVSSTTTNYSAAISTSTFRSSDGWYKMTVANGHSVPSAGQSFRVSGASFGAAPYYYDWLNYSVSRVSGNTVYATATLGDTTNYPKSWKSQNGKPFSDIAKTVGSRAVTISWSVTSSTTVDPSAPFIRKDPIYSAIVPAYSISDVELTLPTEVASSLLNTETVVDIPIFAYIKSGVYYYFNDVTMNSTKVGGILRPPAISSKPTTIPLSAKNLNANADIVNRDYRFTIARYEYNGTSWNGYWLQSDNTFASEQSPNKIIYSQSGVSS